MTFGEVFVLPLRCELTADEKVRKSVELADGVKELERLEAEKTANAKTFKDKIDQRKLENTNLAYDVRTGTEERPVECYEYPRFDDLQVDIIRSDMVPHALVRSRNMQPHERQMQLPEDPQPVPEAEPAAPDETSDPTTH